MNSALFSCVYEIFFVPLRQNSSKSKNHGKKIEARENFTKTFSGYLLMVLVLGMSNTYLCFSNEPTQLFTQQWLMLFVLIYTNDQIIFRSKPWIENAKEEGGGDDS